MNIHYKIKRKNTIWFMMCTQQEHRMINYMTKFNKLISWYIIFCCAFIESQLSNLYPNQSLFLSFTLIINVHHVPLFLRSKLWQDQVFTVLQFNGQRDIHVDSFKYQQIRKIIGTLVIQIYTESWRGEGDNT